MPVRVHGWVRVSVEHRNIWAKKVVLALFVKKLKLCRSAIILLLLRLRLLLLLLLHVLLLLTTCTTTITTTMHCNYMYYYYYYYCIASTCTLHTNFANTVVTSVPCSSNHYAERRVRCEYVCNVCVRASVVCVWVTAPLCWHLCACVCWTSINSMVMFGIHESLFDCGVCVDIASSVTVSCMHTFATAHVEKGLDIQYFQHPFPQIGSEAIIIQLSETTQMRL